MSDQGSLGSASLVPATRRDLVEAPAANPLVARALTELAQDLVRAVHDVASPEPQTADAYYERAIASYEKREYDQAIADLDAAISLDANYAAAFNIRGMAWLAKNGISKATRDINEAIRLDSSFAAEFIGDRVYRIPFTKPDDGFFSLRGLACLLRNDIDRALRDFTEAIRLNPNWGHFSFRGEAHAKRLDYDRAISDFKRAIGLKPKNEYSLTDLAWLLATCPKTEYRDGNFALDLATQACELTGWVGGNSLSALAAAYAELGQFDEAEQFQMKALQDPEYQGEDGAEFQQRLALYKQRKTEPR